MGTLCAAPRPALARGASMRPRALLAPGVPEAGCPEQRAGNGGTGGALMPRGLPEHIPVGRCSNGAAAHPWQSAANSRRGSAIAAARSAIGRHHDGASKPHVPAARTAATKAPARTAAKIDFCRRARPVGQPTARNIEPTKRSALLTLLLTTYELARRIIRHPPCRQEPRSLRSLSSKSSSAAPGWRQ